jgi:peptide/nickel transport system permease protein
LSVIKHALLPIITYLLATIGVWILAMKSSTISTLGEDYINVAKARGLSEGRILTAYVGRNAMLPLVTRLAISIGFVLGGSVIVEKFFSIPDWVCNCPALLRHATIPRCKVFSW